MGAERAKIGIDVGENLWHQNCSDTKAAGSVMMVAMAVVAFFILGMFLSMLGSSPRSEAERPEDAEAADEWSAPII